MRGVASIALAALFGLAVPFAAQATDLPVKAPAQQAPEQVVVPAEEGSIYGPLLIGGVAGAAALLLLIHEGNGGEKGACPGVNCRVPVSPF